MIPDKGSLCGSNGCHTVYRPLRDSSQLPADRHPIAPFEQENIPNNEARQFGNEYVGFVCTSHTSHSYNIGKMRRVTCEMRVRLTMQKLVQQVLSLACRVVADSGPNSWTFLVLGGHSSISYSSAQSIVSYYRLCCQMGFPQLGLYLDIRYRVCLLSISPGMLTKMPSNKVWADNIEVEYSHSLDRSAAPVIDTGGPDIVRCRNSVYYSLYGYIASDRPPRPSLSSSQTPRAVCLPFCPSTAPVSSGYLCKPRVTTLLYPG